LSKEDYLLHQFIDIIKFFIEAVNNLKKGPISLHSSLQEVVLKACGDDLAYVDNRKDAKERYRYDFWGNLNRDWLKNQGIEERLLYSESAQFPDLCSR